MSAANNTAENTAENRDQGFSLLETLVALMIMATASLALFQSTTAMLSLSDKAVGTAERTLDEALSRRAVHGVLAGLIPAWKEEDDAAKFTGTETALTGVTSQGLSPADYGAARFTLSLEAGGNSKAQMVYSPTPQQSRRQRANAQSAQPRWTVLSDLPTSARFSYQDSRGAWHAKWPPDRPRARLSASFAEQFTIEETLPTTIALSVSGADRAGAPQYIFRIPVTRHALLPARDRL